MPRDFVVDDERLDRAADSQHGGLQRYRPRPTPAGRGIDQQLPVVDGCSVLKAKR